MYALEIEHLSFSYEKEKILEDINLTLKKNDFLAIIGPNGGGKSTLLKLILGINKLQSGEIKVFGEPSYKNLSDIGYVPQNTNVNIDFPITVMEVVMLAKKTKKNAIPLAMDVLKKVGIEKEANKKIGSLSGGQRQRVMIARALFANPKILLLDEPTSNIDPTGQKEIYDLLKKLNKNIAIIVVSHDISITLEYATKVAYINTNLVLHDMNIYQKELNLKDAHFCEVELMQLMEKCKC